jgi:hypothetical protein
MTLLSLEIGKTDYGRSKGVWIVFLCLRLGLWRRDKWCFEGSLFFGWPPVSWFLTWPKP